MKNKISPIIVFGTGRSGTTIFMEALFRHSELAFFSNYLEKKPSATYLNYCRFFVDNKLYRIFGKKKQINGYNFFEKFVFKASEGYPIWEHLLEGEVNFGRDFLLDQLPSEKIKQSVQDYISDVISKQGREKFAVKITGPGRLTYLNALFPNAHFIYLKRSFLPTLSSFLKVDFWKPRANKLWWKGAYSKNELEVFDTIKNNSILSTAFQLKKILDINEKEIFESNLKVKVIKYEEFVENPKKFLSETLDFCGLPYDKDCFKYLEKNKLVNRNKKPNEYFDEDILQKIEMLIN
jgi:hypothetical protein